jgi:hypothetical protein
LTWFQLGTAFDAPVELRFIPPGLFMIDEEGELSTTDVKAKFVIGKPQV